MQVPVHKILSDMSYIDANAAMPQTLWSVSSQTNDYLGDVSILAYLQAFHCYHEFSACYFNVQIPTICWKIFHLLVNYLL